ncbi:ACP S-malonyltransferase [Micromonospora sp. ZYX-F-536]|uniref:ACP S-malonyltransferase n=1 Tax=Micromonospora sp. ZYX-F-536 TaxID=3457629 RepID=UPI0040408A6B
MTGAGRPAQAWLFPGQGAQRPGMGLDLLSRFADHRKAADRVLGYSIRDVCDGTISGGLRRTEYVQPALFVVEYLAFLARMDSEPAPAFLAGHSVGELTALCAAGCFEFECGLRLVKRRGELMGQAAGGAMAAVVGLAADTLAAVLSHAQADDVDVANYNSPEQTVLSGPRETLDALATRIRAAGGRYVPLNVSAAFHSRYMELAARQFAADLAEVPYAPPRIPVIANATAQPYPDRNIADLLTRQITAPVRWRDSMRTLAALGVRDIVELGPGDVLTRLWAACSPDRENASESGTPSPTASSPPGPPSGQPHPPAPTPATRPPATTPHRSARPSAASLGSATFRRDFGVRHAYLAGSMYRGISSVDLVVRMANAGMLGFFGTGGLPLTEVETAIGQLRTALGDTGLFGMNLLYDIRRPAAESAMVDLYLRHDIRFVEAAAYTSITPALVRFRLHGAHRGPGGRPVAVRRVLAKVSRPEVATAFMSPPPKEVVDRLVTQGLLTEQEAAVGQELPVSEDVCVEADSAGHTDGGVALTLVPSFTRLRDALVRRYSRPVDIRLGASGGLGAPEAVAAAFVLGADFVVTGSVNQCTVEAGTSALVKDMLADLDVQDTTYAPAGDMFELGARVQVMRKGTLFAARANKLYQLYRNHGGIEDLDARTRATVESSCFGQPLEEVWERIRQRHQARGDTTDIARAEAAPKLRMGMVFRQYFVDSTIAAMDGKVEDKVNFQVHCGPAMGAFNRFADETGLGPWRHRHADAIAEALMSGAADLLGRHTGATSIPVDGTLP